MTVSKLLTLSGHRVTWFCTSDLSIKCLALNGQLTKSLSGWFLRHFKRWCWKRLALILCTSSNGQIINSSGSQRDHSSGADQAIYATESKNKRQHFFEVEETSRNSWISSGSAEQGIRRLIEPKVLLEALRYSFTRIHLCLENWHFIQVKPKIVTRIHHLQG